MLPIVMENLQTHFGDCQISIRSVVDQGSEAVVIVSVHPTVESFVDDRIGQIKSALEEFKHSLESERELRNKAESQLQYATKLIVMLGSGNMTSGKTYHIHGSVGQAGDNFGDAQVQFNQISHDNAKFKEALERLVAFYRDKSGQIAAEIAKNDIAVANESIETIATQIKASEPNTSRIREALISLRKVTESAAGSLAASAIRSMIPGL
jgi:F0F1-type ATP synthase membrane subunit b/b'